MRYWLKVLWNYWVAGCDWGTAKFSALPIKEQNRRSSIAQRRWITAREHEKMRRALQEIAQERLVENYEEAYKKQTSLAQKALEGITMNHLW